MMNGGTDKHVSCCDKHVQKVAVSVHLMPLYQQLMFCTCSLCLRLKESGNMVFHLYFLFCSQKVDIFRDIEDAVKTVHI